MPLKFSQPVGCGKVLGKTGLSDFNLSRTANGGGFKFGTPKILEE